MICIPFVSSENQLADLLTKGLPIKRFEELTSKVGMMDIHLPAWGGVLKNPRNYGNYDGMNAKPAF